jgi:PII-like signaling protein
MEARRPAKLLRLHLSERDQYRGKMVYEVIVEKCRELGIAGATVFRGVEGFGESAEMHRAHLFAHDLPIVVTIVDSEANIQRLLPVVEEIVDTGLIAVSDVEILRKQKQ